MPELCRFMGLVIPMYYSDHDPPHIHVRYAESRAAFRIEDFGLLEGDLPPRAIGLTTEWMALHEVELMENWNRARAKQPVQRIEPLR